MQYAAATGVGSLISMFAPLPTRIENDIEDLRYHHPPQSHQDNINTESQVKLNEHSEDQLKIKKQNARSTKNENIEADTEKTIEDASSAGKKRGRKPGKKDHTGEGVSAE